MMNLKLTELESDIFATVCQEFQEYTLDLIEMCEGISQLDIACSMGIFARQNGYTRPHITTE